MILNPPKTTAEKWAVLPKSAFSRRKMGFLQKKAALSCRKMPFPAEKCTFLRKNAAFGGHIAGNSGNCRRLSRIKNASQLSQEFAVGNHSKDSQDIPGTEFVFPRLLAAQCEIPPHIAQFSEILSFLSLVFRISLVNFKQRISLVILVFSLSFPRIVWVRQWEKVLGKFEVFPW